MAFMLVFVILLPLLFFAIIALLDRQKERRKNFSLAGERRAYEYFFDDRKFTYARLNKSNLLEQCSLVAWERKEPLFASKKIIENKNYITALCKFVDYKINNTKLRFREKGGLILIEQLAAISVKNLLSSGKCRVFKNFNMLALRFKLKKREQAIFKVLLLKFLLSSLFETERELEEIDRVIKKSKNAKSVKKYRKMLLFNAEIYGIFKFNTNSGKLLFKQEEQAHASSRLLVLELLHSFTKIKLLIAYAKVIFC